VTKEDIEKEESKVLPSAPPPPKKGIFRRFLSIFKSE